LVNFLKIFNSEGQAVSEENMLKNSTNQKQELPVAAMFFAYRDEMSNLASVVCRPLSFQILIFSSETP
jgi:hypothetical protein